MSGVDKYKDMLKAKEQQGSVYDQFMGPIQKDEDDTKTGIDVYKELLDTTEPSDNANVNDSVDVNLTAIPIARQKKSIRETHKTKAFYIRNDLAKLIDKDIKTSRRGAMTEIVNALFEEYYRSQGRLK